ncbi:myocardin-related transcription factor A-like isoform X2 [Brachyhypopomus gauderio]|uniref:myocardin-related transcription factor A-like isoform X2 n=1 Tax=Brachyhypopomus gauderio TaxID=698409 RepID=UPI00404243C9
MEGLQEACSTSSDAVSVAGASGSTPSSHNEALTNDVRVPSLQPAPSLLLPIEERRNVLQIKLQQRRTREELVSQGIMPPLKSSAAFHEQRRSLERARTEDYLKRKIRTRPERSELVRMHILEETSAEPSLQAKQLRLKKARLADDLNDKLAQRPGPMELIQKNILSVNCCLTQAVMDSAHSSCDEDSDALSPDYGSSHQSPRGTSLPTSSPDTLTSSPSPAQAPPPPPPPSSVTTGPASEQNLANGMAAAQKHVPGQVKAGKTVPERSKKQRDNKPKVRKLKYHQYIPPDQKVGKEPPPVLDSTYAKLLHQQQLFLQLQIISQQHCNYQAILPAPPRPPADQQAPSTKGVSSVRSGPPSQSMLTQMNGLNRHAIAVALDANLPAVPSNLDELKVAELKQELKLRGLTVSGTKNDLIERLKNFQQQNGGSAPTSTTGGASVPAAPNTSTSQSTSKPPAQSPASATAPHQSGNSGMVVAAFPLVATLKGGRAQPATRCHFGGSSPSPPGSPSPSEQSLSGLSPEDHSCNGDAFGDMVSSPLTQLSLQHSPPDTAALPTGPSAGGPLPPGGVAPVDKDLMLREKDQHIATLTRMLQEKQQQVEALRSQLLDQRATGGACKPLPPVAIKEEPEDIPMEEEPEQWGAVEEHVLLQNQFNLHRPTQQHRRKKTHNRLQNPRLSTQSETCSQQTSSQQTCFKQTSSQQTSSQQTSSQQTCFKQTSSQQTSSQQTPSQQTSSQQVSQVVINQQPGRPPSFRLDVLKSNSSRTLVMDSNGNQFLLTLTNHNAENQANDNSSSNIASPITLQRTESTPTKLSSESAPQMPNRDVQSKPLTICKQPIKKALKPEKHVSPSHTKARYALCNVQPFLTKVDPASNLLIKSSSNQREETCGRTGQHAVHSPSSSNLRSTLTSRRKRNGRTRRVDNLFDILVQNGEISENFRPSPDPALSCLCPNSPPLSPSCSSPLQLSPASPPITDTPQEPFVHGSSAQVELSNCRAGSGRLEDFLESTTGKPLLGVEPGGHVTLIDELHSQLLSTPSILDHPSSPMDTYDLGLPSSRTGLELAESALDSMDWLDLGMGGTGGEGPGLVALSGHPSTSVFSTDFLDSSDLHLHWDSCL